MSIVWYSQKDGFMKLIFLNSDKWFPIAHSLALIERRWSAADIKAEVLYATLALKDGEKVN
jgi:hypothetical protein